MEKSRHLFRFQVRFDEDEVDDQAVEAVENRLGTSATSDGDLGIQNSPDIKQLCFNEVGERDAIALDGGEEGTLWKGRIRHELAFSLNGSIIDELRFFSVVFLNFLLEDLHGRGGGESGKQCLLGITGARITKGVDTTKGGLVTFVTDWSFLQKDWSLKGET